MTVLTDLYKTCFLKDVSLWIENLFTISMTRYFRRLFVLNYILLLWEQNVEASCVVAADGHVVVFVIDDEYDPFGTVVDVVIASSLLLLLLLLLLLMLLLLLLWWLLLLLLMMSVWYGFCVTISGTKSKNALMPSSPLIAFCSTKLGWYLVCSVVFRTSVCDTWCSRDEYRKN